MAFTTTTFVNHNHHSSVVMDGTFDDPFEKSIFMVLHNDFAGESPSTGKQQLPTNQQQQQQPQQGQQGDVVVGGRQEHRSLSPPNQNTMPKNKNNNISNAARVYPVEWDHVTDVGDHDCLLGRGGGANKHSGNIKFRQLIKEYKFRYIEVPKIQKPKVAEEVVQVWRNMNPPGRFLARINEKQSESSSSLSYTPDSSKSSSNDVINKNSNSNNGDKKNDTTKKDNDTKQNKKEKEDRIVSLTSDHQDDDDDDEEVWYDVGDKRARAKASMALRERTPDAISFVKQLREEQDAKAKQGAILVQQKYSSASATTTTTTSTTTSPTASAPGSAPTSPARSVVHLGIHQQKFIAPSPHPPSPPQFLPRRGSDATICSGLSDMHMAPHLQQQLHLQQQQQQQPYHHIPLPHPGSLVKGTPGVVQGRPMLHPSLSHPCFRGGSGGRPTLHPSLSTPCFPAQPHSPPPSPQSTHSTQSAPPQQQRLHAPLFLHEQQQMQVRTMEEHLMRKQGELEALQQHILSMRRQRAAQGQEQQQLSTSPSQVSDCTPMMGGGGVNSSSKGATGAAASRIMDEATNTMLFPVTNKTSSTIENDKNKSNTPTPQDEDEDDRRNMDMYRSLLENYFDRGQIQEEEVGSDLEDDDDDWDHDFTSRNRDKRRRGNGGGGGGDKSSHDTRGGTRGKVLNTSGHGFLLSSSNAAHTTSLSHHHHPSHLPTTRRTADSTTTSGDRAPRQGVARNKSNMSMQSTSSARSDDDLMAMSIISAELGYLSMDDRDDDEVHSLDGL
jgi:hypothetical protein